MLTTSVTGGTNYEVKGVFCYTTSGGVNETISWGDLDGTSVVCKGEGTVTPLTVIDGGLGTTIPSVDWSVAALADTVVFFSEGEEPLIYDPGLNNGNIYRMNEHPNKSAGSTVRQGSYVTSAFGRLWVVGGGATSTSISFSDLLSPLEFTTGLAGELDVASTFTYGGDEVVAVGAQAGYLIIFNRNSILIYADDDAFSTTFNFTQNTSLVETIQGVGVVSAKTVMNTGSDILFLSNSGVQSLGRLIQEKSQPLTDISKNIRDDLVAAYKNTTNTENIKAVYSPADAFYLLMFTEDNTAWCFDTRSRMQDGTYKVTFWTTDHNGASYDPIGRRLIVAQSGGVGVYNGYSDNGAEYEMSYLSPFLDFGIPSKLKLMKKVNLQLIGKAGQQLIVVASGDYSSIYNRFLSVLGDTLVSEYFLTGTNPVPETAGQFGPQDSLAVGYAGSEYTDGIAKEELNIPIGASGEVLQIGFTATIVGAEFAVQKVETMVKVGRTV
jgi:hypothetical protein